MTCPVCELYDHVALAAALLADLTEPTWAAGQVPPGLGGTVDRARAHLLDADRLIHGRLAELGLPTDELDACVEQTVSALDVWLTPNSVGVVAAMARQCRRHAHSLAWSFFATAAPCSSCGGHPWPG